MGEVIFKEDVFARYAIQAVNEVRFLVEDDMGRKGLFFNDAFVVEREQTMHWDVVVEYGKTKLTSPLLISTIVGLS